MKVVRQLIALYDAYAESSSLDYGDHTGMSWEDDVKIVNAWEAVDEEGLNNLRALVGEEQSNPASK